MQWGYELQKESKLERLRRSEERIILETDAAIIEMVDVNTSNQARTDKQGMLMLC